MDTSTITLIANASVSLLGPYLKSLCEELAKKTAGEVGEKMGESIWNKAEILFDKIKNRFSSKPETAKIIAALEKCPDDTDTQAVVRFYLKDILEKDKTFAAVLAQIISEASDVGADNHFHTTIFGEVKKLVQIGNVYGDVRI